MSLLPFVNVAYAGIVTIPKPDGFTDPAALAHQACTAAQWLFVGALIFSVVFVLIAAFEYMTSSGDPAKVKVATSRLIYVAIGVAVALIAFLFPGVIAAAVSAGTLGNFCS